MPAVMHWARSYAGSPALDGGVSGPRPRLLTECCAGRIKINVTGPPPKAAFFHSRKGSAMSAPAALKTTSAAASGPSPAVMGTYARQDVVFERGEGSWLVSTKGDRYLDLASGIAVNALGHANPRLAKALNEQAGKL